MSAGDFLVSGFCFGIGALAALVFWYNVIMPALGLIVGVCSDIIHWINRSKA